MGALAQESRLAIFRRLVEAGPRGMNVGKIMQHLAIPPATLSFHLKELTGAGLITAKQEGRFITYAADFRSMNALVKFMTENCCGGNPCVANATACKEGETA